MNKAGLSIALIMLGLVGCSNHPAPEEQLRLSEQALDQAKAVGASAEADELALAQDKLQQARIAFDRGKYRKARMLAEQAELDARLAEAKVLTQKRQKQLSELEQQVESLRKQLGAL